MKIQKISIMVMLFLMIVVSLSQAALLDRYLSVTGVVVLQGPQPPINVPIHIGQCLNNGWQEYTRLDGTTFKNQGLCVSYVATNMCSQDGWKILTREDGSSFRSQGQCVSYFVTYADEIQQQLDELVLEEQSDISILEIQEETIEQEIIEEEVYNIELVITNNIDLKVLNDNNRTYTFLCDNDFTADKYDWYFGDASTIMDSEKAIEHTFSKNGSMYVTCYATNSTTTESSHATITVLIE